MGIDLPALKDIERRAGARSSDEVDDRRDDRARNAIRVKSTLNNDSTGFDDVTRPTCFFLPIVLIQFAAHEIKLFPLNENYLDDFR